MLALNLESVKPVNCTTVNGERLPLFKSRYTSNLSPVHVSDYMSGKMEGIPSISTSCLENPICRARMENGESVCSHCFAAAVSNGSARVFDLEIVAIDDEDPSAFSWYYHDADAGEYHAIRRQSKPARGYRAALEIDPATGDPRTYSGLMPTKAAALAVLHHLAPAAVELPGLPAWLR